MTFATMTNSIQGSTKNWRSSIMNTFVSKEIHDQGKNLKNKISVVNELIYSGETSFCWAYSIATMLRQSLRMLVANIKTKYPDYDFNETLNYLNQSKFHKRLRDEITMIPIPKLKISAKTCPMNMDFYDYQDWVVNQQSHILEWAIDRVCFIYS